MINEDGEKIPNSRIWVVLVMLFLALIGFVDILQTFFGWIT